MNQFDAQEGEIANIQAGIQQMDSMAPSSGASGGSNPMSFQPQQGWMNRFFSSTFRPILKCFSQFNICDDFPRQIRNQHILLMQMPSQTGGNMMQQQQHPPPQSQPQQRTYPQAIMSTAPRSQAQSGDFGAAPFLPPPPAKTGRPGQQQPQQMPHMPQQQQQFGSSMAGFATMPRAPQQQQQNGPMGSMAAASGLPGAGTAAFPANFSNNGENF